VIKISAQEIRTNCFKSDKTRTAYEAAKHVIAEAEQVSDDMTFVSQNMESPGEDGTIQLTSAQFNVPGKSSSPDPIAQARVEQLESGHGSFSPAHADQPNEFQIFTPMDPAKGGDYSGLSCKRESGLLGFGAHTVVRDSQYHGEPELEFPEVSSQVVELFSDHSIGYSTETHSAG
jgi:hypothetical protein